MKAYNCLLLAATLLSATEAKTFAPRSHVKTALKLRGGDLGRISGDDLAKSFSVLASCDAIGGLLCPRASMKMVGVDIASGSISETCLTALGASAATISISGFLAVTGKTSVNEAVGYGLGARLAVATYLIATGKHTDLGVPKPMVGTMWALLTYTVWALFQGRDEGVPLAQVVSLMIASIGYCMWSKPECVVEKAKKAGGTTTKGADSTAVAMAGLNGGYMIASGLTTALLVSGNDPAKTVGYVALSYIPTIMKYADAFKIEEFAGIDVSVWGLAIMAALLSVFAGTVL